METIANKGMMTKVAELPVRNPAKHTNASAWTLIAPEMQGNKLMKLMVTELGPGGGADPNTHPGVEHAYFVLSGRAKAHVEGEEFLLEPGSALYMPPGALHDLEVIGGETFRFVVVNVAVE